MTLFQRTQPDSNGYSRTNNVRSLARPVLICGAGGHGKVVADVLGHAWPETEIRGFLDDRQDLAGATVAGLPVAGTIRDALELGPQDCDLILAIGTNDARQRMALAAGNAGFAFATAVHPSATIGRDVMIGQGTVVMPNAVVNAGARLGDHVIVNTGATVDHDSLVEDFAHISPGAHLAGGVHVGVGAHVGLGACVLPGVRIGAWATVGAGATVIRRVAEGITVVGTPAAPIRGRRQIRCVR